MPDYDGFPIHVQVPEAKFEVAVYELLCSESNILASRLLYHRIPVQHFGPRDDLPRDIAGRRLSLFERADGENNVWHNLSPEEKVSTYVSHLLRSSCANPLSRPIFLLSPYPCIAVQFQSPAWLRRWLHERLFEQKPEPLPVPAAPTRFYVALFTSKIEATIRNIGNMIGWEDDNNVVGSIAAAAKQSLLRLIPHIIPADSG
jgi:hypothetical protein